MIKIVKLPNSDLPEVILFDEKEFKATDFNLEEVKDITLDELKSEHAFKPLMSLNDFILRTIRPKERTISHVLSECGIECFAALDIEKTRIDLKTSKLSSNQRKMVIDEINFILKA